MAELFRRFDGDDISRQGDLRDLGPIFGVALSVFRPYAEKLKRHQAPPETNPLGLALIDTGAMKTCIDLKATKKLNLISHGTIPVVTAERRTRLPTYEFSGILDGKAEFDCPEGVGCNLDGHVGKNVIVLIGMDVLSLCRFTLNGPDGSYTLSF